MPKRAPRPCKAPGCGALVQDGASYCPGHAERAKQERAAHEARRPTAAARGYGSRWQKVREGFLRSHPLCAVCGRPANVVDHIKPHKGDWYLFWDKSNWQSMCAECHSVKTASEDGGFSNRRKYNDG